VAKLPEDGYWEFSRISVLKVTLQSVRLLLTVSYRRMGEQAVFSLIAIERRKFYYSASA